MTWIGSSASSVYNLYGTLNTTLDNLSIHWILYAPRLPPTLAGHLLPIFIEKIETKDWELPQLFAARPPSLS